MALTRRALLAGLGAVPALPGISRAAPPAKGKKNVLVELFTSQGCDLCPEAGRILGELAELEGGRVVPIGFHVDYFNDPWADPLSDKAHSQRQMAYNALYKGPKNPEYGLYYTPMLMIDGRVTANGRDKAGAARAIRMALAKAPGVNLEAAVTAPGVVEATISPRPGGSFPAGKLLLGAVVTEDRVVTAVPSGENGGKTLTDRFAARKFLHEFLEPKRRDESATATFVFPADLAAGSKSFRAAVFAQDPATGRILQAESIPWR